MNLGIKRRALLIIGSVICMLSLTVSLYLYATGFRLNIYRDLTTFILVNAALAFVFFAFLLTKRCSKYEKRVYYCWIGWALLGEIIDFSSFTISLVLSVFGLFIGALSIYYATKV